MAFNAGNAGGFFSGLVSGFAQAREKKQLRERDDQERKLKTKLFDIQLQKEQMGLSQAGKMQSAQDELLSKLGVAPQSQSQAPASSGIGDMLGVQDPVAPAKPAGMSLTDLLADPQNAALLLQSGMVDAKTLIGSQEKNSNRDLLQSLLGGGSATAPGGFGVTGIKLDSQGNPMYDLGRNEVKNWKVSGDGSTLQGLDAQGNVIATRPASPADRAPEDKPLTPTELADMRGPDGAMLSPGTTLRQAQQMGARTSPKPAEADKKALMLLKGMQDSEGTIKGLSGADTSSVRNKVLGSNAVTKLFTSEDFRKYKAAGQRWAQNYLYLKSGAQASQSEIETTFETYFPQPNDSEAVKAQKEQARQQEAVNIQSTYGSGAQGTKGKTYKHASGATVEILN